MVGDGSYLMLNSEIATSVMLGPEADHRRARQSRLRLHQPAAAGVRRRAVQQPARDVDRKAAELRSISPPTPPAWARMAEKVDGIAELEAALARARKRRPHLRHRHRDRSRRDDGGRRGVVGRRGAGGLRRAQEVRDARAGTTRQGAAARGNCMSHPPRHQSDRLEQRRPARTRRRHAARDLPGGGRAAGFTGIEKGNKFPTEPTRLQDCCGGYGLTFVSGWYSAPSCKRSVERRDRGDAAASRPAAGVRLRRSWCSPRPAGTVQDSATRRSSDRPRDRRGNGRDYLEAQRARRLDGGAASRCLPSPHGHGDRDAARDRAADGGHRPTASACCSTPAI